MTSKNEGTPVSIIEAMASLVPVITTGVGGVKDLLGKRQKVAIENKGFELCERGVLCSNNNTDTFAKAIEYTIKNNINAEDKNIIRAREYVLKNYSDSNLIKNIEGLYSSLI
jgi:glycosyltransferase involved in cell wall biosynthesis